MRDELLDDLDLDPPAAREHHYRFAHQLLPFTLLQQPDGWLGALVGPEGRMALLDLWDRAGARLVADERIEPDGLAHEFRRFGDGHPLLIVTLPEARESPEAERCVLTMSESFRLFTQEVTLPNEDGSPAWCFCEWTADGTHLNRGRLPRGSLSELLSAIALQLDVPLGDALRGPDASVVRLDPARVAAVQRAEDDDPELRQLRAAYADAARRERWQRCEYVAWTMYERYRARGISESEAGLLTLPDAAFAALMQGNAMEVLQLARVCWEVSRSVRPLGDPVTDRAILLLVDAMLSWPVDVETQAFLRYALHRSMLVHGCDSVQAVAMRALVR